MMWKSMSFLAMLLMISLSLAVEPTTLPTSIKVSDKSALEANKDKMVTIEGIVSTAVWSKTGRILILKFADTDDTGFTAVVFKDNKDAFDNAFNGDAAKTLTGSKAKITGKLSSFHDKPQIVLNQPAQIILDKEKSAKTDPADSQSKS